MSRFDQIAKETQVLERAVDWLEPDVPISYLRILLYIAAHEKTRNEAPAIVDIVNASRTHKNTISRIIGALSDRRVGGQPVRELGKEGRRLAFGLVERMPDPIDRRIVRVRLSEKGRKALADILAPL